MEKALTQVGVLLPVPVEGVFDYAVPEGVALPPGTFVRVPLRSKASAIGVVWGIATGDVAAGKIKQVEEILDVPPLPSVMREFVAWVADYTMTPLGMVLRMVLNTPAALEAQPQQILYRLADGANLADQTLKRRQVASVLADGRALTLGDLAKEAAVGPAVIKAMVTGGWVEAIAARHMLWRTELDPAYGRPHLSASQEDAALVLRQAVEKTDFSVTLLDGVTGSGKTEVYFEAIAAALTQNRQALVLVPEIALSAQFVERFAPRFGTTPALWHSDLTPAQRRNTWRGVAEGNIRVVIGARSALFLPFPDLGLIVVDEENEASYKQEDGVIYHARDMAVVRAKLGRFPAVLVSATPSLETIVNAERGRYGHVTLPARFGGATLPEIALVDLRQEKLPAQRFVSEALRQAIAETIANGEQALLFLNRRGYAPLTLCRVCGHRMKCPNCTSWLVEHRYQGRLVCHYCGHGERLPEHCPRCDAEGSFAPIGPGVERIAEEIKALFPEGRLALMASDLMEGAGILAETLRKIRDREVDIIVGTQIIAKGHHFPKLTLVGVIDADLGLSGGDLRASERTYQLLQQVSGRAGRAAHPGRAMIQTYEPDHPVMQALLSGDHDHFLAVEKDERARAFMPPFTRLAALIVSGDEQMAVEKAAIALGRTAPHGGDVRTLGPAPAALAILRNRYRYRLLLRTPRTVNTQGLIREWLARTDLPKDVRVQIDIDPYNFL